MALACIGPIGVQAIQYPTRKSVPSSQQDIAGRNLTYNGRHGTKTKKERTFLGIYKYIYTVSHKYFRNKLHYRLIS